MSAEFTSRKVPQAGERTSRDAQNDSDSPIVRRILLPWLAQATRLGISHEGDISIRTLQSENGEDVLMRVPVTTKPILEHKVVDVRGGRAIGGGTSKDAIRRAKRQQRRQGR